jgi:MFS superfamily sulfate permease-like transporter
LVSIRLSSTRPIAILALVLVAGGILASYLFDLGAHGVDLVGHVPRGLPTPQLPSAEERVELRCYF